MVQPPKKEIQHFTFGWNKEKSAMPFVTALDFFCFFISCNQPPKHLGRKTMLTVFFRNLFKCFSFRSMHVNICQDFKTIFFFGHLNELLTFKKTITSLSIFNIDFLKNASTYMACAHTCVNMLLLATNPQFCGAYCPAYCSRYGNKWNSRPLLMICCLAIISLSGYCTFFINEGNIH